MSFHTDRYFLILFTWQKPCGRKKVISYYRKEYVHMNQENLLPTLPITNMEYDSSFSITIVIKTEKGK